jgi:hypothetical protein
MGRPKVIPREQAVDPQLLHEFAGHLRGMLGSRSFAMPQGLVHLARDILLAATIGRLPKVHLSHAVEATVVTGVTTAAPTAHDASVLLPVKIRRCEQVDRARYTPTTARRGSLCLVRAGKLGSLKSGRSAVRPRP